MLHLPKTVRQAIHRWYPRGVVHWYAIGRTILYWSRFSELLKRLPQTGRIVDIGCGYGLTVNLFSLSRPHAKHVGFDPDEGRVDKAKKTIQPSSTTSFVVGDARSFSFLPGDTVTMVDVLHHIPHADHQTLLRHIAKLIGPTGLLLIADMDKHPTWKFWCSYAIDIILYPTSTRNQFWPKGDIKALLISSSWHVMEAVRTDKGGIFSTILYAARPVTSST